MFFENIFNFQLVHTSENKTIVINDFSSSLQSQPVLCLWPFGKTGPYYILKGGAKALGLNGFGRLPSVPFCNFQVDEWTCCFPCEQCQKGSTFFSLEVCVMHMWCPCPVPGHTPACWDHAGGAGALLQWPAPAQRVQQNAESWRLLQEQQGTCSGFKSFIPCVCVCLLCCTRHGSRYRIDTG